MPDAETPRASGRVRPEFAPTLADLLARRGIPVKRALAVVAVALAAGAAAYLLLRDPLDGDERYIHRGTPVFNLLYGGGLKREPAQGAELVRVGGRRGGTAVTVTVRPFELPRYNGRVDGVLPIVMTNLARRFDAPGLRRLSDGKGRISFAPGYQNEAVYRNGETRRYALDVLIVPPAERRARSGLLVSLRQVRGARATAAGRKLMAAGRSSLRSLRFGTELKYPDP